MTTPRVAPRSTGAPVASRVASPAADLMVEVVAGPDRQPPLVLAGDRIVVGRDIDDDLHLNDPTVGPHHALLSIDRGRDGVTVTVVPLLVARRLAVDGRPVTRTLAAPLGHVGLRLAVGSSVLRLGLGRPGHRRRSPRTRLDPAADAAERWVARRPFETGRDDRRRVVDLPSPPPEPSGPAVTGLVGALVGLVSAAVVATFLASAVFMVFGLVASVVSVSTWAGSWLAVGRRRRRARSAWAAGLDRLDADLRAARRSEAARRRRQAPDIGTIVDDAIAVLGLRAGVEAEATGLWVQRRTVPDRTPGPGERSGPALPVVVGVGRLWWSPATNPVAGTVRAGDADRSVLDRLDAVADLTDVPVVIELTVGRTLAMSGCHRAAVARAAIAHLAWRSGPADWRVVVVTDRPDRWAWIGGLPHAGTLAIVDGAAADPGPRLLAALDEHDAASAERSMIVVVVDGGGSALNASTARSVRDRAAVIVVDDAPPAWADEVVATSDAGRIEHRTRLGTEVIEAQVAGITERTARTVADALGRIVDPDLDHAATLPTTCGFVAVHRAGGPIDPVDPMSILGRWGGAGPDPAPLAVVGHRGSGPEVIDLAADGPHALVVGTTGAGKSELLRTMVASLAVHTGPTELAFVLVDYKGGAAFDACAALPHVLGVVTELEGGLAARALRSFRAELRRRATLLRGVGAVDLADYRRRTGGRDHLPRLVVVIDEFATLAAELPDFLPALVDIAQRGRSLGLHLVLATQRPGGAVGDDIRANTALRMALRTQEASESVDVLGRADAARLPRSVPGRAVRRIDSGELRRFQVASCTGTTVGDGSELASVVAAVTSAARRHRSSAVPTPPVWLPPLPDCIETTDLRRELAVGAAVDAGTSPSNAAPAVGVIDDPDRPCRRPLRWTPGDGLLLIVGAVGSATTSTLLTVVDAACATAPPGRLHVYAIDARGEGRLDELGAVAHCGGVVRLHETERLRRLIDRVAATATPTPSAGAERPSSVRRRTVVAIDGLDALRQFLQTGGPGVDADLAVAVRDLVLRGPDRGVEVVATARGDALPAGTAAAHTWVGAVDDPIIARSVGWTGSPIPRRHPGRFGLVPSGLVAQVVRRGPGPTASPDRSPDGDGPRPVDELPPLVRFEELGGGGDDAAGRAEVDRTVIGRSAESFAPDGPDLGRGRHLLVVGRPASGVSTSLATIAAAWQRDHPEGRVVRLRADGVGLDAGGPDEPGCTVLVVIDDADRFADPDGRLDDLVARPPGGRSVAVVAGIRIEALRGAYGHWTRRLAAEERGIALARAGEAPTDALGCPPPRRPVVAQRPGLGWLVDRGTVRALQIAVPPASSAAPDGP